MKNYRISFILVTCLFSISSIGVFGQNFRTFKSEIDMINSVRWRIGPFRIDPMIGFQRIGYDNNIYQMQQEEEPIGDYTATISPQVNVFFPFRRWLILSFTENPSYVYYINEKRNRALNNSYSTGARFCLFRRFVISGNYIYSRAKRRVTSEFDAPAWIESTGYNGSIFFETSLETSLGISGSISKIRVEDIESPGEDIALSGALDRQVKNGFLEFYYRISDEVFFFSRLGYAEYDFEDFQAQFRNSYSYQANAGIRFPLLGRIQGLLSLGYMKFLPREQGRPEFSGIVGNTGLDFKHGRLRFRVSFNRDIPFSLGTNIFYINNRYSAGMSYYLSQSIRLDYDFSYGGGSYPEPITISTLEGETKEITRRDTYRAHSASIVFRILQNTGIGFSINFWERESSFDGFSRDRMFIGGYITYDF